MSFISKLFGRKVAEPNLPKEPVVPVPIPALKDVLLALEEEKGSPLSEAEVLKVRDTCACMMMALPFKRMLEKKRGYRDLDPENCWQEWQTFRTYSKPK